MKARPSSALILLVLAACGARQGSGDGASSADGCRRARDHFQRALAAEAKKGDFFDLAVEELKAAYDASPAKDVLLHVALVYEEQGDYENALIYCRRYDATVPDDRAAVARYCAALTRRLARQRILYETSTTAPATADEGTRILQQLVEKYERRCPQVTQGRDICEAVLAELRRERDDPAARIAELDTEDSDDTARARAAMIARATDDPYASCGG